MLNSSEIRKMQIKSHKRHSISNSKTGKNEIWQYQVLVRIWTNLLSCYYITVFLKLFYIINPQRAFLDIFFLILTPSILIAQIYSTYVNVLWPYGRPLTIVISTFFFNPPSQEPIFTTLRAASSLLWQNHFGKQSGIRHPINRQLYM